MFPVEEQHAFFMFMILHYIRIISFGLIFTGIFNFSTSPAGFVVLLRPECTLDALRSNSLPSALQHRLCRHPEAAQLGHRAEEGGDGYREEEHACPRGVPRAHPSAQWEGSVAAGRLHSCGVL